MAVAILPLDLHTKKGHLEQCKSLWSCSVYSANICGIKDPQLKPSASDSTVASSTDVLLIPFLKILLCKDWKSSPVKAIKHFAAVFSSSQISAQMVLLCFNIFLHSWTPSTTLFHLPVTHLTPFFLPDWQTTISGKQRKWQRMLVNILARWCFRTSGSVSWQAQSFWGILCPHSWQQSGSQNPSHEIAGKSILLSLFFDCAGWYRLLCLMRFVRWI